MHAELEVGKDVNQWIVVRDIIRFAHIYRANV